MCDACSEVTTQSLGELKGWPMLRSFLAYHFTRRYPRWAQWLPRHVPRLLPAQPAQAKPLPLIRRRKRRDPQDPGASRDGRMIKKWAARCSCWWS